MPENVRVLLSTASNCRLAFCILFCVKLWHVPICDAKQLYRYFFIWYIYANKICVYSVKRFREVTKSLNGPGKSQLP